MHTYTTNQSRLSTFFIFILDQVFEIIKFAVFDRHVPLVNPQIGIVKLAILAHKHLNLTIWWAIKWILKWSLCGMYVADTLF